MCWRNSKTLQILSFIQFLLYHNFMTKHKFIKISGKKINADVKGLKFQLTDKN